MHLSTCAFNALHYASANELLIEHSSNAVWPHLDMAVQVGTGPSRHCSFGCVGDGVAGSSGHSSWH